MTDSVKDAQQDEKLKHLKEDVNENKDDLKAHLEDCIGWRQRLAETINNLEKKWDDKHHSMEKKGYWAVGIIVLVILLAESEKIQAIVNTLL